MPRGIPGSRPRPKPAPEPLPAGQQPKTWEEWLGPPRTATYHRRLMDHPPWTLDWQRNPAAPLPPGWVWGRCLCVAWAVRPPDFHGQVRDRDYAIRFTVGPAVTLGDPCDVCQAPLRQVRRPADPYPWPFDLIDPDASGEVIQAGRRFRAASGVKDDLTEGSTAWAVDLRTGVLVPYRPGGRPLARWSKFPSAAAERAWCASQRRQGLPVG